MSVEQNEKLPYLFLDVDGCLNAFGYKPTNEWGDNFQVYVETSQGQSFPHTLSKAMGAALMELPVEIVWLTTWMHDAWKVGQHIGLDMDRKWTVLSHDATAPHQLVVGNWKLNCLMNHLHEDARDFVWIDDDAIYAGAREIAEQEARDHGVRCHFIIPESNCGISRAHIQEIKEFIGD